MAARIRLMREDRPAPIQLRHLSGIGQLQGLPSCQSQHIAPQNGGRLLSDGKSQHFPLTIQKEKVRDPVHPVAAQLRQPL